MRYIKVVLLIAIVIILSYGQDSISAKNDDSSIKLKIIGEGINTFYMPGHTQEIGYNIGYILKDPLWIIPPTDKKSIIYLEDNPNIPKFQNKRVHVEGSFVKVPGKKFNNWTFAASYNKIIVDTIYVIE